jgi:hypothetical protein
MLLLIGFALGFLTSFLIFGCNKTQKQNDAPFVKAKELKKEAATIDVSYQKQIETLSSQNAQLQQQLNQTNDLLQQLKLQAMEKENQVKKLLLSPPLLPNVYQKKPFKDYEIAIFSHKAQPETNPCDSLKKEVASYIKSNHKKDSVYELQLLQFDSLLTGKDLVIETSQKAYSDLKLLFDQSLSNQSILQKENLSLRRVNKRQKFRNKILAGGLMILSGFTANYMLRH